VLRLITTLREWSGRMDDDLGIRTVLEIDA
jgi:hypothetical protein